MTQIKFTATGANSAVGGFSPGDIARVSTEMAKHLVEEANVAQYDEEQKPEPAKKTKAK